MFRKEEALAKDWTRESVSFPEFEAALSECGRHAAAGGGQMLFILLVPLHLVRMSRSFPGFSGEQPELSLISMEDYEGLFHRKSQMGRWGIHS